jgi:hypothetical protein
MLYPAGESIGSDSLLSHLINTNVRCMLLFQWFYDVELCMDMNTSYNNTNRLFPTPRFALPNPLGNCSMHRLKRLLLVLYHRRSCRRPTGTTRGMEEVEQRMERLPRGSKWDSSDTDPNGAY